MISEGNMIKEDKIGGFDRYDVESKARTLIEAEEIKNGDAKLLKVVLGQVKKTADAAMEAAQEKDAAAKRLQLEKKVGSKLNKMYKDEK